jgi:hypothetical protein
MKALRDGGWRQQRSVQSVSKSIASLTRGLLGGQRMGIMELARMSRDVIRGQSSLVASGMNVA